MQQRKEAEEEAFQEAMRYGRMLGLLPAIPRKKNTEKKENKVVNEREESLVLELKSKEELAGLVHEARENRNVFTIHLKRYKGCRTLKGLRLGELGAKKLAKALRSGACSKMKSMDLGWNRIKFRGIQALSTSFSKGACHLLLSLDLRMNDLDTKCITVLLDCMTKRGLPNLQDLNLQGNVIGDRGAMALSHHFFKGTLHKLKSIILIQNDIGNAGGKALWSAFASGSKERYCPSLEKIDMSRNKIKRDQTIRFVPCPAYIRF